MTKPVRRERYLVQQDRPLLDRILDVPRLPRIIPSLPPEVLHRVIEHCGLEGCSALVALATPEQLARVFDLDLWHAPQPGLDERFDAARFGVWLEVLAESGAAVAAEKLAEMDADVVIAGLAQHLRVFDCASVMAYTTTDGEEAAGMTLLHDGLECEIGGYRLVARRTGPWDAMIDVLMSLEAQHHERFHQVMRGCRALSHSRPEPDGLDNLLEREEQAMFDLAFARERRRKQHGFVTPAQARAFLQMSRCFRTGPVLASSVSPITRAHCRVMDEAVTDDVPDAPRAASADDQDSDDFTEAVAAITELLRETGVLAQPPRALLGGSGERTSRLAHIQALMQAALDRDPDVYASRNRELAFVANVIAAGCSLQARPLTPDEASNAAAAVCNLGLENWPRKAGVDGFDDALACLDLVSVFQCGWTILHDDVVMYAADRLVGILGELRCGDGEIQAGLDALRVEMTRQMRAGTPWQAREALDVMTSLDAPSWAALLGLIDECPVLHAAIGASRDVRTRSVRPDDFEFISENSQIASVHAFVQALPKVLRGT